MPQLEPETPRQFKIRNRLTIGGKKKTKQELISQAVEHYLGNENEGIPPLTQEKIAQKMNRSTRQVIRYLQEAVELGMLRENSQTGRLERPPVTQAEEFREYTDNHPITNDEVVEKWKQNLLTRKKGGKPLKSWKTRLNSLEEVCNRCGVTPTQIKEMTHKEVEQLMERYKQLYEEGLNKLRYKKFKRGSSMLHRIARVIKAQQFNSALLELLKTKQEEKSKQLDSSSAIYTRVQGIRDFCKFYNKVWGNNVGGIMSQKIVGHGQYADIRLTEEEFDKADKYMMWRWGIDSDVYRWFWIGVESCARANALYNMTSEYSKYQNGDKTIFLMEAVETKTDHIKGGKWVKYITRADTHKAIDALRARGVFRIYESKFSKSTFLEEMALAMTEIFLYLGKTNLYFYEHTNHVLRHIGAHYWLAKGNYKNHSVVAKIGGWNTVDEMVKSYGELPPEKVLEAALEMIT